MMRYELFIAHHSAFITSSLSDDVRCRDFIRLSFSLSIALHIPLPHYRCMQPTAIDWESLIENTKLDDHIGQLHSSPWSFFERQVFNLRARSNEEERAESITDDL